MLVTVPPTPPTPAPSESDPVSVWADVIRPVPSPSALVSRRLAAASAISFLSEAILSAAALAARPFAVRT